MSFRKNYFDDVMLQMKKHKKKYDEMANNNKEKSSEIRNEIIAKRQKFSLHQEKTEKYFDFIHKK